MSIYWNDRVKKLEPYVPGEQPRDRVFVKLNTNENPYPPSPRVGEAIQAVLAQGAERLRLYPDPDCWELRQAVAKRYGVKPEQVFAGNGSDEILAFGFGAFFNGNSTAPLLFPDITYSFYPVYAGLWNIPFRTIPVGEDFSIDAKDYLASSSGNIGGAIFPNPNAPTGRALPLTEILRVATDLEKQGRVLIVDEAYAVFGAESAVGSITAHPNLLTVHTLSKAASLAGLRAGFAIGNQELIEGLCRIRDSFNSYTVDRLAQAAAAAALGDAAYYEGTTQKVIATRERTAAALAAMGYQVIPSRANFLFIRSSRISGAELFASLRDRGILARHFNKPRIADFLRVSIGTDTEMDAFLVACGEIEQALDTPPEV
jgi:histidinol-phosphate aminotransferase